MTLKFDLINISRNGTSFRFIYQIHRRSTDSYSIESDKYVVDSDKGGSTMFQIRITEDTKFLCQLHIRFFKEQSSDERKYIMKYQHDFMSNGKRINKTIFADDNKSVVWHLMDEGMQIPADAFQLHRITFTVSVSLLTGTAQTSKAINAYPFDITALMVRKTPNASLHDDTELTDFELRGVDGSVHLHKAIVAAASPVLRRMFAGAWRETAEGVIEVPDTTKATLQHFKDYIYLDTVPDTGLEHLLLLASMYILPDLEERCAIKMINAVKPETARDLIHFAVGHHSDSLLIGVLQKVQKGSLSVDEIQKYNSIELVKSEKH